MQNFPLTAGNLTTGIVDTEALFDPASVPIHLDKVMCTGDERGIIDCYHSNGLVANCTHRNDTGIVCSKCDLEGFHVHGDFVCR